jgi:hypothetical protein
MKIKRCERAMSRGVRGQGLWRRMRAQWGTGAAWEAWGAWKAWKAWKAFDLAATGQFHLLAVGTRCPVPCLLPHPAQHRPDDGGGDTEV